MRIMKKFKVICDKKYTLHSEERYIVVDEEGNVLDDAQGFGYKSYKRAVKAYLHKQRYPVGKKHKLSSLDNE